MNAKKIKNIQKAQLVNPIVSISLSVQSGNNIRLETKETLQLQPEKIEGRKFDRIDPMQTGKNFLISPLSSFFCPLDGEGFHSLK